MSARSADRSAPVCNSVDVPEEQRLQPTDPVSEECLPLMTQVIAAEIGARLAVGDYDIDDPEWAPRIAGLTADALLDSLRVRPMTDGERRWLAPG